MKLHQYLMSFTASTFIGTMSIADVHLSIERIEQNKEKFPNKSLSHSAIQKLIIYECHVNQTECCRGCVCSPGV